MKIPAESLAPLEITLLTCLGRLSADDFAATLGVPKKSIALVLPTNDQCKSMNCPFNAIISNGGHCPAHEKTLGIISKIVRLGYLLQNFKKAIVQRRDPRESEPTCGHPCRGEICWCGATDAGLRDVRDNVQLWGLKCQIRRHAELTAMEENQEK